MKKAAAAFALCVLMAAPVRAEEDKGIQFDGRAEMSYFKYNDDYSNYSFSIMRAKLSMDVKQFWNNNEIHLDLDSRQNSTEDYHSGIPDTRIKEANLELKDAFVQTDITVGRQYVNYVPGARVDGLHAKYKTDKTSGIGAFGGTQPDPYQDSFSVDYNMAGAYAYSRSDLFGYTLGLGSAQYKGNEDSTFLYMQGDYKFAKMTSLYANARLDRKIKDGSGVDLTNLHLRLNHRIGRIASIGVSAYQYRPIRRYASSSYIPQDITNRAVRVNGAYNLTRTAAVFGSFDYRTRSSDNKNATISTIGLRESRILNSPVFGRISYRKNDYFTSQTNNIDGQIGAQIMDKLSVDADFNIIQNKTDGQEAKLVQNVYGVNLSFYPVREFYIVARYETNKQEYKDVDPTFASQAPTTWKSSNYFILAGYRF